MVPSSLKRQSPCVWYKHTPYPVGRIELKATKVRTGPSPPYSPTWVLSQPLATAIEGSTGTEGNGAINVALVVILVCCATRACVFAAL